MEAVFIMVAVAIIIVVVAFYLSATRGVRRINPKDTDGSPGTNPEAQQKD